MASSTVTARNTTAGILTFPDSGLTIPALGTITISGDLRLSEIIDDITLQDAINTGSVVLGNGTVDIVISDMFNDMFGASSSIVSIDNTVPRFDGIAGALQGSSVVINDFSELYAPSLTGGALSVNNNGNFIANIISDDGNDAMIQFTSTGGSEARWHLGNDGSTGDLRISRGFAGDVLNDNTEFALNDSGIDVYTKLISNVVDPVSAQDAATKAYVDSLTGGVIVTTDNAISRFDGIAGVAQNSLVLIDDTGVLTAVGLAASTTGEAGTSITSSDGNDAVLHLNSTGGMQDRWSLGNDGSTGDLVLSRGVSADFATGVELAISDTRIDAYTKLINNVVDPVAAQDAATKNYVDGLIPAAIVTSDNALSRFDGVSGAVQNSSALLADSGLLTLPGILVETTGSPSASINSTDGNDAILFMDSTGGTEGRWAIGNDGDTGNLVISRGFFGNFVFGTELSLNNTVLDVGTKLISSVVDPVAAQDAATKGYVDGLIPSAVTSTDNAITRFNGTTGLIQDSSAILDDAGLLTATGLASQTLVTNNTGDVLPVITSTDGNNAGIIFASTGGTQDQWIVGNAGASGDFTIARGLFGNFTFGVEFAISDTRIDAYTKLINNVVDPVAAQDAATKNYVDTLVPSIVSIDHSITRFNGVAGVIQDSLALIDDLGNMTATGYTGQTLSVSHTGNVVAQIVSTDGNDAILAMDSTGGAQDRWSLGNDGSTGNFVISRGFLGDFALATELFLSATELNVATKQIKDVVDPTDPQDAVTKLYADALVANIATVTGTPITDNSLLRWNGTTNSIEAAPLAGSYDDVGQLFAPFLYGLEFQVASVGVTNAFLHSKDGMDVTTQFFSDGGVVVEPNWLIGNDVSTGDFSITRESVLGVADEFSINATRIDAYTKLINNVVDPVAAQDAATKNYVDTFAKPRIFESSDAVVTNSTAAYVVKLTSSTVTLEPGTYEVQICYSWNCDSANDNFQVQLQSSIAGAAYADYGVSPMQDQEPSDSLGTFGATGTDQKFTFSKTQLLVVAASATYAFRVQWRNEGGGDASMWEANIKVQRTV